MKSIHTLFVLLLLLRTTTAEDGLPEKIDFRRHIRPILSQSCFACHGPDAADREAELRLDVAQSALGPREEYPPATAEGQ